MRVIARLPSQRLAALPSRTPRTGATRLAAPAQRQSRPARVLAWMADTPHALCGIAVARILFGIGVLGLVLHHLADREFFWGAGSAWSQPFRDTTVWSSPMFGFFSPGDTGGVLTLKLAVLGLAALAMIVGIGGRIPVAIVLLLSVSLLALSPTSVDTEDIIIRIMLAYLLLCQVTARLSADQWLARRRGARRPLVPAWLTTPLNNAGVVLICGQLCIVYVMAGLAKLRGPTWRDGTAMYYTLHLDQYSPWPELGHALAPHAWIVLPMSWVAVLAQILFPVLVAFARTRLLAVLGLIALHVGIAVLLGLGLFSLAMVAADAVFVRDESIERWRQRWRRWRSQRRARTDHSAPASSG